MSHTDSTQVTVELPADLYERFEMAADADGKSVERALHEAVLAYAVGHRWDSDDPMFAIEPATGGDPIEVENLDEHLYGEMADEME